MFDHYHAEEILSIIIKNSIKFSKENGLITLSADANEKKLIFTVKDNGVGISKEHLDNILVPIFSDFKNPENRFKKPSIKLSYVKKILEHLDGQLLIDSKVNEWTEAKIILPFSYAENKKLKSEKEIVNKKEKSNILLVDDNPLTLYLHKEQLGKYTNIIDTAESGLKSIEMCNKNKYDVFLWILPCQISMVLRPWKKYEMFIKMMIKPCLLQLLLMLQKMTFTSSMKIVLLLY